MPDPRGGGGQKGHMPPPEATASHTLPPEKKTKKKSETSCKNWYECESNTCAFTECKNGRALVKYGTSAC